MNNILEIVKNNDLAGLKNNLKFSNINEKDEKGNSLLHIAIFNNNPEMVEFLILNSININVMNNNGDTPLHYSIIYNHFGIFKYLLKMKCQYDMQNYEMETPFMVSIRLGREDMASVLFSLNPNLNLVNTRNENIAFYLMRTNMCDMLDDILKRSPEIINSHNYYYDSLLHEAVRRNNQVMTEYLLKKGMQANTKNKDGETPIFMASKNENTDLASKLMEAMALIDIKNIYGEGLTDISSDKFLDFITFKSFSVKYSNYIRNYPLHIAVIKGDIDEVRSNLNVLNANKKDDFNKKPIDYARLYNHPRIEFILKKLTK